jgi:hypothetical protein
VPNDRLKHDCSAACATEILEVVSPCLRDEEKREAWGIFCEAVKACLMQYEVRRERELTRLAKPSPN